VSTLTTDEQAVLDELRAHPGLSAHNLSRNLKRRPEAIFETVRTLISNGNLERRPTVIRRSDGNTRTIEGLYEVVAKADPNLCPVCRARRRHFETGAECRATSELRALGEALDWQRVPYGYGRAIQTGPIMWEQFLNTADYPSMTAATRSAREWIALNAKIRQQYAATTA
jgi:hypothetical protein